MRDLSQHRYLLQPTLSPMNLDESTFHPGALRSDDAKQEMTTAQVLRASGGNT